jgi:tellurite resistance protein TehA-like permease
MAEQAPASAGASPGRLSEAARTLFPGYFALVMATGIVSVAAKLFDLAPVAVGLFWINCLAYAVLWGLTLARLVGHPRALLADLFDHARGPGFFTLVAATAVVGVQAVVLYQRVHWALGLWWIGIALWCSITYAFFAAVTTKPSKPALGDGLNGGWLVAVVATQSIAVLGATVAPMLTAPERALELSLAMHLAGILLYLPLITLLLYRWLFFDLTPRQLTPPYWINMGALAISCLAGARILQNTERAQLLADLAPFLRGTTCTLWAGATWWIPLLAVLGFWRHVLRREPFRYDPQYWGMVFPLGMYSACTFHFARTLGVPELMAVAHAFLWVALAAWSIVFAGMARHLVRGLGRRAV